MSTENGPTENGPMEFRTPMGKIAAALGLDRCAACGREIGEEERRHVRTWQQRRPGQKACRQFREARCGDCGPGAEGETGTVAT